MKAHIVKSKFILQPIKFLAALGMVAATAVYAFLFIFVGVAPFRGVPINVISVFDILLGVRNITAASAYTVLLGAVFSVWYIFASIWMIKLVFRVLGYLKKVFSAKKEDGLGTDWLLYLLDSFGSISYWITLFVVVLRMFFTFSLSETTVTMLIVGIVLHVLFRVCIAMVRDGNVSAALHEHIVCSGFFLAGVALMMNFLCTVDVRATVDAFRVFNVVGSMENEKVIVWVFNLFVKPAMMLIMQFMMLRIFNESVIYMNHRSVSRDRSTKVFVWMIVLTIMAMVVSTYAYGDMWGSLKTYAAGLASAGLLFFVRYLPAPANLFKIKTAEEEEAEDEVY